MSNPAKGVSQRPTDWINFYTGTDYNPSYTFEFVGDALSERFLLDFRYYYTEGNEDPDSRDRFVEFTIGEVNELTASIDEKFGSIDFNGERFYSILNTQVEPSNDRTGQVIDIFQTAIGKDLDVYISIQDAAISGLSQEIPSYSNVENGLGIFSYRLEKPYLSFKLNDASAKHVFQGALTIDRFRCARHGTQSNSLGVTPCRN